MSAQRNILVYSIHRIIATIPVVIVVTVIVFLLIHMGTSDPAAILAGEYAGAEQIENIRVQLGLHLPLHEQFWIWLKRLFAGDLGTSIYSGFPVAQLIRERIEPTLSLALLTMGFAVVLAVPLGLVAGWKTGTWIDRLVMAFSVAGFSIIGEPPSIVLERDGVRVVITGSPLADGWSLAETFVVW